MLIILFTNLSKRGVRWYLSLILHEREHRIMISLMVDVLRRYIGFLRNFSDRGECEWSSNDSSWPSEITIVLWALWISMIVIIGRSLERWFGMNVGETTYSDETSLLNSSSVIWVLPQHLWYIRDQPRKIFLSEMDIKYHSERLLEVRIAESPDEVRRRRIFFQHSRNTANLSNSILVNFVSLFRKSLYLKPSQSVWVENLAHSWSRNSSRGHSLSMKRFSEMRVNGAIFRPSIVWEFFPRNIRNMISTR